MAVGLVRLGFDLRRRFRLRKARAVKGRPKSLKLLMEPRAEARAKLLKGTKTKKDKKVDKGKKAKK